MSSHDNSHKKVANRRHEDQGRWSSSHFGGRISAWAQRVKRYYNRLAKRRVARDDVREQVES